MQDETMQDETMQWRAMVSAPKDGSRVIVVIRSAAQGPTDVDVVRWMRPPNAPDPCWVSTDSTHDCTIIYDNWEVSHWMPLPLTMPGVKMPKMASKLPVFPRDGQEIGGSGI